MGNSISDELTIGTLGELLVQIRFLEYDVQAAAPLKDSGNDLIAIRGESFPGVQVKASAQNEHRIRDLPEHYHILALVDLAWDDHGLHLDRSRVYLLSRKVIESGEWRKNLDKFVISASLVDKLFKEEE